MLRACLAFAGFLILAQANRLEAQDWHVYYDLFTDSLSFRQNNKLVEKPKIRKGDLVVVHFTEYNPYLYQVETDVEQSNSETWGGGASSGAFASLIGGLVPSLMGAQAADGQAPGPLSIFDIPLLQMGESSVRLRDLFANSRGADQLLEQAKIQLQELSLVQAEMDQIYQEIQTLEKSEKVSQLAYQHLSRLMYDPRIKPSLLKKIAKEYLVLMFPGKTAEDLQMDDAFVWQEIPTSKQRLLQALQAKQDQFDKQLLQLGPITQDLSNLELGNAAMDQFTRDLRKLKGQSETLHAQLDKYLAYQAKNNLQALTVEQIVELIMKFRELGEQTFTYDCAVQMEKELAVLRASFKPLDSLANGFTLANRTSKVKVVKLEARGGLHISTGVGAGFSHMFNGTEEFSVKENVIVVEEGNVIQPALITYLHFYPNNSRGFTVAGTFGLGIPLGGANLTALNFYLGPSLLFGRGQRIVLTGGLNASSVQRLGKGYKAGDAFDLNLGDIPTRNRYELGYFVGLSFNIQ